MADQPNEKPEAAAPVADAQAAPAGEAKTAEPASAGDDKKTQETPKDGTKVAEGRSLFQTHCASRAFVCVFGGKVQGVHVPVSCLSALLPFSDLC